LLQTLNRKENVSFLPWHVSFGRIKSFLVPCLVLLSCSCLEKRFPNWIFPYTIEQRILLCFCSHLLVLHLSFTEWLGNKQGFYFFLDTGYFHNWSFRSVQKFTVTLRHITLYFLYLIPLRIRFMTRENAFSSGNQTCMK
jgi:hypothetical protein